MSSDTSAQAAVADAVASVAAATPGVAQLYAGAFAEIGTYLPGRRVAGVRLNQDVAEVHVALLLGANAKTVAQDVRERVLAAAVPGIRSVDVVIEDVQTATETTSTTADAV